MIRLAGVSKRFGQVEALRQLDLEIRSGEWLGVFGHNGSGKTTLIRTIVGLSKPSSGQLTLDGKSPTQKDWRIFRRKLGFMPERVSFYEHLTGAQTLRFFCRLRGLDDKVVAPMLERVGLAQAAGRKIGGYSKGMRQRLNLAQALLGDPEILILDEPIEGLDPRGVRDFFQLLRSGATGTVVMSSHRLSEVCDQVDRACVLVDGESKALGSVDEICESLALPVTVYLYPTQPFNGTLRAALSDLGASSVLQRTDVLVVEVSQRNKTVFLMGLHAHRQAIRHVRVQEPSMERAFFDIP